MTVIRNWLVGIAMRADERSWAMGAPVWWLVERMTRRIDAERGRRA